jgi:hypothetical protein
MSCADNGSGASQAARQQRQARLRSATSFRLQRDDEGQQPLQEATGGALSHGTPAIDAPARQQQPRRVRVVERQRRELVRRRLLLVQHGAQAVCTGTREGEASERGRDTGVTNVCDVVTAAVPSHPAPLTHRRASMAASRWRTAGHA